MDTYHTPRLIRFGSSSRDIVASLRKLAIGKDWIHKYYLMRGHALKYKPTERSMRHRTFQD